VITTSGALGILIPPSIVMVMYAVATNTSVGQLFIAGIIPGLFLATMLGVTTWWRARKNDYPRLPKASWAERWRAFRASLWGLLLIVVVIGGIYTGIFTPTEAAAMSAVYAFFVAVFVYKDMTLAKVPQVLLDSANMSAMLLYIITNAVMFSYLLTSEQIPQELAAWMLDRGLGVIAFLLVVNVLLLLAGNVMEPSSIVLIMAPILFPVAMKLGIDPVHFGIMMVVNMEVGCATRRWGSTCTWLRHHQDGHHRAHDRRMAVAHDDARVPHRRHLLARALALAAPHARDDAVAAGRPLAGSPSRRAQSLTCRHAPASGWPGLSARGVTPRSA
jgi:tripartite ATP-independent transporter DctM subunit